MWRARPIFISSTFADFQAERDHLRNFVFPELEERLRKRRHNLEWVDLRIGVATASLAEGEARELHVLKVCLAEVRRSRPFLIVLLGDRYGWVPPIDRVRTAAIEEGFAEEVAGRSVTDLEINFGVLSDPEQQPRSFFYFREPLPYADMPADLAALYAEAYAKDAEARARAERLKALKNHIAAKLPDRVRRYAVGWDPMQQRVTGLEVWGRQVLEDVWRELDAETAAAATEGEPSWQQAERTALDDYIEVRTRGFVGRQQVLRDLVERATSPVRDGDAWGTVLIGEPGSGKSAVFGELVRKLRATDAIILAHASGASLRSASHEIMLRRWIEELAGVLGVPDTLPDIADPDSIASTFRTLLTRMAEQRRVVLVVDALDQFERMTESRHATWVPRVLPDDFRLIATAVPGEASAALAQRRGVEVLSLAPLDMDEARRIAMSICDSYHRVLEPEVLDALLSTEGAAGPAWGNPLWLVLAVEELNLVDSDDFARAKRSYSGNPAEQLRALLLDVVAELPANVPDLYRASFAYAEQLFGPFLVRAFLGFIAVARAGWSETVLRDLLPRLGGEPWDELRFASLRRLFRGQLRQTGASGQWDFAHAQMRVAAKRYIADQSVSEAEFHTEVAEHLLSLPSDNPVRQTETMVHLMGSGDRAWAARYYGSETLTDAERDGATWVLGDMILAQGGGLDRVVELLGAAGEDLTDATVAHRFNYELEDRILVDRANLSKRATLLAGTREMFQRLTKSDPENAGWQHGLASSLARLGGVLSTQGDLRSALDSHKASLAIIERLALSDPENTQWQRDVYSALFFVSDAKISQGNIASGLQDLQHAHSIVEQQIKLNPEDIEWQLCLSVSHSRIGQVLADQGNLTTALDRFRTSHAIVARLAEAEPGFVEWQRRVSSQQNNVGDVLAAQGNLPAALDSYNASYAIRHRLAMSDPENARSQQDLSDSLARIGDVLVAQGSLLAALDSYNASYKIAHRLAKSDPENAMWLHSLSILQERIGKVHEARGDLLTALDGYKAFYEIFERLAKADPENVELHYNLGVGNERIGDIQMALGDLVAALTSYQKRYEITSRLSKSDPEHPRWQLGLVVAQVKIGDVLTAQGNLQTALDSYNTSYAIADRLAKSDPGNAEWQYHLSAVHQRIGDVRRAQGKLPAALDSYNASLAIYRLVEANRGHAVRERDVSVIHQRIGDVLYAQGRLSEALDSYQLSYDTFDRLAKSDPENAEWQRDLAYTLCAIGDVLVDQANPSSGLDRYQAAFAALDRLMKSNSKNASLEQSLASCHSRIGDMLTIKGDLSSALDRHQASLAIAERLAASQPEHAERQCDLVIAHQRIGHVLHAQGKLSAALDSYQTSLAVMDRFTVSDPRRAEWQRDLVLVYSKLAVSSKQNSPEDNAVDWLHLDRAIIAQLRDLFPGNTTLKGELARLDHQIAKLE